MILTLSLTAAVTAFVEVSGSAAFLLLLLIMISAGVLAVVADDGEGSKLGGAETSDDSEIRLLTPRLR